MTTHETVNLTDPDLTRHPSQAYAVIREQGTLASAEVPGVGQVWVVARYDDVKTVLSDPRVVKNPANVPDVEVHDLSRALHAAMGISEEYRPYFTSTLTQLDAPEHTRLRKLVSRAFTARRITALRPRVERIAEDLLDELPGHAENGVVDLLKHFAYPLPVTVIGELVGVPRSDRAMWKELSGSLLTTMSSGGERGEDGDINHALRRIIDYCHELIERRRQEPTNDLTTALVQAQEEDGDRLTTVEMVQLIFALVSAGHETTANLIGNGTVALLTHSDQRAKLLHDPALVPGPCTRCCAGAACSPWPARSTPARTWTSTAPSFARVRRSSPRW